MKVTSEDTVGGKPTEVPQGIAEARKAKSAEASREMDLLPTEVERLDDLVPDLLGLKLDGETQESAMLEEEDDDATLDKSSKHKWSQ